MSIARLMTQATGAEKKVLAFLSSRQTLNQFSGHHPDASGIVRIGTTNSYAFIFYDTASRGLFGNVVTYVEETNTFSIGGLTKLDDNSFTTARIMPSPVWDEANQKVIILGQGNTFYPHVYVCTVSGSSINRTGSYAISSSDSGLFPLAGPCLFYDQVNSRYVAFLFKSNAGFRVFGFTVSGNSVSSVGSITQLGGNIVDVGDYVPIVHDPVNNVFHMFFYQHAQGFIGHYAIRFQGGNYANLGFNVFSNSGNNDTRPSGAEYDPIRNKIVVSWVHSYTSGNQYINYISILTPTNSGNYYTTDSVNLVSYYSSSVRPSQSSYEPVSNSTILFVNGYVYQVILTKSGAFDELLFLGYTQSAFHFSGGRQIAALNSEKSILIFGDNNNNYGLTVNGQYTL